MRVYGHSIIFQRILAVNGTTMRMRGGRSHSLLTYAGEAVVAVQIFGHEHVDTFRLLGKTTVELSVPSLSTAYPRTNPTVRYWHQLGSAAAGIADYDQYIMELLR